VNSLANEVNMLYTRQRLIKVYKRFTTFIKPVYKRLLNFNINVYYTYERLMSYVHCREAWRSIAATLDGVIGLNR